MKILHERNTQKNPKNKQTKTEKSKGVKKLYCKGEN